MKFRKKPVVIEAVQWLGGHTSLQEITALGGNVLELRNGVQLSVGTPEGVMIANLGDWIIRGIKGEVYPCKPDIFDATYEVVK